MSKKFVSLAAPPTPYEREILEILIEECAEVQQRATKALRFGPDEVQPGQGYNNKARLAHEVGDLLMVIERALDAKLMSPLDIQTGMDNKFDQLKRFMQTTAEED